MEWHKTSQNVNWHQLQGIKNWFNLWYLRFQILLKKINSNNIEIKFLFSPHLKAQSSNSSAVKENCGLLLLKFVLVLWIHVYSKQTRQKSFLCNTVVCWKIFSFFFTLTVRKLKITIYNSINYFKYTKICREYLFFYCCMKFQIY